MIGIVIMIIGVNIGFAIYGTVRGIKENCRKKKLKEQKKLGIHSHDDSKDSSNILDASKMGQPKDYAESKQAQDKNTFEPISEHRKLPSVSPLDADSTLNQPKPAIIKPQQKQQRIRHRILKRVQDQANMSKMSVQNV